MTTSTLSLCKDSFGKRNLAGFQTIYHKRPKLPIRIHITHIEIANQWDSREVNL
jgi:hypothetical protein